MKKIILVPVILIGCITILSCSKPVKEKQDSITALLTSVTWIFDELTEYEFGVPPETLYKRGAGNNLLDLSKVEHSFLADGTYLYKDETGASGSGTWKLVDNNTRIKLTEPLTGLFAYCTDLIITGDSFVFRITEGQDYSVNKCIPKP